MGDDYIRLPVDGQGKATRTRSLVIGGTLVHQQVIEIADVLGNPVVLATNESVNSLLKPGDTLTKVSTLDTITNVVSVKGDVTSNEGGDKLRTINEVQEQLLSDILKELKKINFHLSTITDNTIKNSEVE